MSDHFCVCCRTPFSSHHVLDESGRCSLCRLGMNGFDAAYTFGAYEGTLRKLVHLYKYERIRTLAKPLARMTLSAFPREERFDLIVPMPMHWRRRWQRGFNQAELLAREIGRRVGLPVGSVVRRTRPTVRQANLSSSQRRRNVAGSFEMKRSAEIGGLRVLLVDDVLTTGATAGTCAVAMKRGGAAYVAVLALARTDRRRMADNLPGADERRQSVVGAA